MPNPEFLAELAAFEAEITSGISSEVQELIKEVLTAICDGNIRAIDTGRSTASWVASTGDSVFYEATDITPSRKLSGDAAKERSLFTLLLIKDYVIGEPVYIANGNDYVVDLEFNGKSGKVPLGFVQLALANFPELQYTLNT